MLILMILGVLIGLFIGFNYGYTKGYKKGVKNGLAETPLLIMEKNFKKGYCQICSRKKYPKTNY